MSEKSEMQQIDITNLNIQQLAQLKHQLEEEFTVFQDSLQTLKLARNRFQESKACLDKITPAIKDNEILIPLTGSMYVSGRLADPKTVLIDIGTGYYAQKDIKDAKDYFTRRADYVNEQSEKIHKLVIEKNKFRDAVVCVMDMKMQKQMNKRDG